MGQEPWGNLCSPGRLEGRTLRRWPYRHLTPIKKREGTKDGGGKPELIEPAVVHDRVRTVATAFALGCLAGDGRYDTYLEADVVTGLGDVQY